MATMERRSRIAPPRMPWWLGAALFGAIAVFFLWEEHSAHILGALPWLLLLACPLIHLLLHGGHGAGHRGGSSSGPSGDDRSRYPGDAA